MVARIPCQSQPRALPIQWAGWQNQADEDGCRRGEYQPAWATPPSMGRAEASTVRGANNYDASRRAAKDFDFAARLTPKIKPKKGEQSQTPDAPVPNAQEAARLADKAEKGPYPERVRPTPKGNKARSDCQPWLMPPSQPPSGLYKSMKKSRPKAGRMD